VVGQYHTLLQKRRREQNTTLFAERMKIRNGIEGTQSELVRAHGLRRARYRGKAKVDLQNQFIGAACNIKRWLRLLAWQIKQKAPEYPAPRGCGGMELAFCGSWRQFAVFGRTPSLCFPTINQSFGKPYRQLPLLTVKPPCAKPGFFSRITIDTGE
jgi:hypothetical protein